MTAKRLTLGMVSLLALTAIVAACGGGGGGGASKGTTTTQNVSGSVSVSGIWVGEEQKSFQAVINDFTSKFPNVKVKYNPAGNNLPTVLTTAVQGGNPPDVAAPAQPGLVEAFVKQGHHGKTIKLSSHEPVTLPIPPIVERPTPNQPQGRAPSS
jgi:ABC-type glycerol-3-phosphate transport system substrate-binding protein